MKLVVEAAGKTDVGTVRTNNEDNFGYDSRYGIFLVCDGMGGQAAGERASQIGVDHVLGYFRRNPGTKDLHIIGKMFEGVSERANALARAIQLANQAVQVEAARNAVQSGMGSTIVAVFVEGNQFSIAHVGDSRIYLIRGETIQQLTSDHSLVMEQVRRGLMTPEEAENSSMQNIIVRALGSEESIEPDLEDLELLHGDTLLLCSDGLSRYVKESRILEVIRSTDNLAEACEKLIEQAKSDKSDDNITCLLLRAREQSWTGRLVSKIISSNSSHQSST